VVKKKTSTKLTKSRTPAKKLIKSNKAEKPAASRKLSLYSNLSQKRKRKKDSNARQKAEYLASLPKHPVKRFFYRLHPKRLANYWFSKRGAFMALKIVGISILVVALLVGGLFAYFRKDLDAIRPGEIAKRVQSTVTTYLDRNDKVLWEDRGDGNYKLVVESEEISDHLKNATIAIEDKDFRKHSGISISGLTRAFFNNLFGGATQGGSTLTQQLVKQVFFADEAQDRSFSGVPRKIKELILSIEVERMYNKDQILTLYLNESPYGGRRNGAQSGAQTYFGKSVKDLTIAEAALLAAIPQNPSAFNPYYVPGHARLIDRQHTVINNMVDEGYITKEEGEEAKAYPIIDNIIPESSQYANIKAPHFVQMVRAQLVQELGESVVGRGGLTVKTTLDVRIQDKLEKEVKALFDSGRPQRSNIGNAAATVTDTQTGQIVALMGSRDFNYPGYGQDNAATSYIQPGSTIKPLVFAELFKDKGSQTANYGSGSILRDERIDSIYGAPLNNWDKRFMGDITIRQGLALSRNIPAVKAMYISGIEETIDTIRELGNTGYCTQEAALGVGLASAIGACGTKQVELVNAYATLARKGVYKPTSTILEVHNADGERLKQWEDQGKQVLDPQIAYIISDILHDPDARAALTGRFTQGLYVNGVNTAAKTGTSDTGVKPKDLWIVNYSPALAMGLWLGNSDTSTLNNVSSIFGGPVITSVMEYAHKEVYQSDGKWKPGDWFSRPSGIQQIGKELYPSWWDKNQGLKEEKMQFNSVNKMKATECTPAEAIVEITVVKSVDPVTKKEIYRTPDGYDAEKEDDCKTTSGSATLSGDTITVTGSVVESSITLTSDDSSNTPIAVTKSGRTYQFTAPDDVDKFKVVINYPNGHKITIRLNG
jgi:membrane peptidoglycan carboxypeptidase